MIRFFCPTSLFKLNALHIFNIQKKNYNKKNQNKTKLKKKCTRIGCGSWNIPPQDRDCRLPSELKKKLLINM